MRAAGFYKIAFEVKSPSLPTRSRPIIRESWPKQYSTSRDPGGTSLVPWRPLVAIELAAVAIASIHREEAPPEEIVMPSAPVDAVITELPPESTPPPEEEPPPPPPPPDEPTEFTIQEPTPPPRPPKAPPPKPRPKVAENKGTGYSGVANYSSARSNWISAPHPIYPYEARRAKQTGQRQIRHHF